MTVHARVHATSEAAAVPVRVLQRACACGEGADVSGKCPACAAEERLGVRPKLTINRPGDRWEREADRIADQVVSDRRPALAGPLPVTPLVQRQEVDEEEDEPLQAKLMVQRQAEEEEEEEELQANAATGSAGGPAIGRAAATVSGGGRPLTQAERTWFEPRLGRDLSAVRIHDDASAGTAARAINARAYTLRNHIAFAPGAYTSASTEGRRLMAHELAHTLQQGGEDTYELQRKEIDDCRDCSHLESTTRDIDGYVNSGLDAARADAEADVHTAELEGRKPKHLAEFAFERLGKQISPGTTPLDAWAESLPATKAEKQDLSESKFAGASGLLGAGATFARLMRVGDLCIGSDKLGHMTENGFFALLESDPLAGGSGGEEAALARGKSEEETTFGLQITGVFSNADIAANLAGLRFYQNLIADEAMRFSIADYISSDWNECNNPSFYTESGATVVWTNLLTRQPWGGAIVLGTQVANVSVFFTSIAKLASTSSSATPALRIAAIYIYESGSGRVTGSLGGMAEFVEAIPARETGLLKLDVPAGYSGLSIQFNWAEDSEGGGGRWNSIGEKSLTGTWGTGGSLDSRGEWHLALGSDPVPRKPEEVAKSDAEIEVARARKASLLRWLRRVERRKLHPRYFTRLRARRARLVFALEKYGELDVPLAPDTRIKLQAFIDEEEGVRFKGARPIEILGGSS